METLLATTIILIALIIGLVGFGAGFVAFIQLFQMHSELKHESYKWLFVTPLPIFMTSIYTERGLKARRIVGWSILIFLSCALVFAGIIYGMDRTGFKNKSLFNKTEVNKAPQLTHKSVAPIVAMLLAPTELKR